MPERLDLRFGIASSLIGQAVGTNGPRLELKVTEALDVYREIQALDKHGFDAPILLAAYSRAIGQTDVSENTLSNLMIEYPDRTKEYIQRFARIDRLLNITPNEKPWRAVPGTRHAIVVLGAGLE